MKLKNKIIITICALFTQSNSCVKGMEIQPSQTIFKEKMMQKQTITIDSPHSNDEKHHVETQKLLPKIFGHLQSLEGTLPLFNHIQNEINLEDWTPTVQHFQRFKDVIILGTGGSSLGGKSLYDLCDSPKVTLHFHDNIDPNTFTRLLTQLNLETTGIIAISKSGSTAETLMQTLFFLQEFEKKNLPISQHFTAITEPAYQGKENPLRKLANHHKISCLDHPTGIGGRFAVFTVVGILPALIAGLDGNSILDGAKETLKENLETPEQCVAALDAIHQYHYWQQGKTQSIIFPYIDRLKNFALWYRQLWAESLGKSGKGTTPIASYGTVDQHSQLQLYLDGPKDKYFTVITTDYAQDKSTGNTPINSTLDELKLYENKTLGDLLMAEQKATINTIKNKGCPVRLIHIPNLNEKSLGSIMMHYILETLAMAEILEVNPFDQPAVEEGKILTREYLGNVVSS